MVSSYIIACVYLMRARYCCIYSIYSTLFYCSMEMVLVFDVAHTGKSKIEEKKNIPPRMYVGYARRMTHGPWSGFLVAFHYASCVCVFHHQNRNRRKNKMNKITTTIPRKTQTLSDIFFLFSLAAILVLSSSSHYCFTMFVQPKDVYHLINFMSTRLCTRE